MTSKHYQARSDTTYRLDGKHRTGEVWAVWFCNEMRITWNLNQSQAIAAAERMNAYLPSFRGPNYRPVYHDGGCIR